MGQRRPEISQDLAAGGLMPADIALAPAVQPVLTVHWLFRFGATQYFVLVFNDFLDGLAVSLF